MLRRAAVLALVLSIPALPYEAPGARAATAPARRVATARHKAPPPLPRAPKRTVFDTYWGVKVPDDYRYMERASDPGVMKWVRGQNAYTRSWLDGHRERAEIQKRVAALSRSDSPDFYSGSWAGGRYFFLEEKPPKQQPFLVAMRSLTDRAGETTVVDPNALDASGGTTIDFYVPSLDGKLAAVSLSKNGTEDGTLHVYETDTGRPRDVAIPRVNGGTAGGSATWNGDGTGLYYTRYPAPGERPKADLPFYQQIWFHKLGTPLSSDTYVLGREFPKIAEAALATSRDGRWILADVSNGDGGEHEYWLMAPGGAWSQVSTFQDGLIAAHVGQDGALYALSRAGAPNKKILRIPLDHPRLDAARVVVPETQNAIESFAPAASRLYVREMVGGPTQLRVYDLSGKDLGVVALPEPASIGGAVVTDGDDAMVRVQSYTRPPATYVMAGGSTRLSPTALAQTSPADFSDCEVRREFATADDGAKIPVNIVLRKGTPKDGSAPLLLYGYGSYGLSETPYFRASIRAWIEQGGVYVDASVRGGGEFGDAWHDAARLGTKKRSMDDFAACARYLVQEGYTRRDRLAIEGGSAGGLLVYGTVVHHPDVMGAAVAEVGYGDVLRTEFSPNGEFNTTEFGTVKDSTLFRQMLAYSPYHHVKAGTAYPSVLALTGVNDPRVESWETYKMVARLQASGTRRPVLMRVSYDSGHIGSSLSEEDRQNADVFQFLFDQLGVTYRPVKEAERPKSARPSL
ncbi:MAG TPA: prolyl oligopeptidase family serine peptidase [Candidatus Eisenbacteria bacterium]|nr:prolyl oligopeptidase family serine peptidase [Candidatus Eisenbacteria bacterium]